jgi:hypothetical protein
MPATFRRFNASTKHELAGHSSLVTGHFKIRFQFSVFLRNSSTSQQLNVSTSLALVTSKSAFRFQLFCATVQLLNNASPARTSTSQLRLSV